MKLTEHNIAEAVSGLLVSKSAVGVAESLVNATNLEEFLPAFGAAAWHAARRRRRPNWGRKLQALRKRREIVEDPEFEELADAYGERLEKLQEWLADLIKQVRALGYTNGKPKTPPRPADVVKVIESALKLRGALVSLHGRFKRTGERLDAKGYAQGEMFWKVESDFRDMLYDTRFIKERKVALQQDLRKLRRRIIA